jgi:hypothetical protein
MKIIISKDRLIDDIKKEFNNVFPYLKIDFKLDPIATSTSTCFRRNEFVGQLRIGDIIKDGKEGVISIKDTNSINQIEQKFAENFGLRVNFFRKSGNLWLEIKMTGDWSLKQQNESGMEVY